MSGLSGETIWASLPLPALLIDAQDVVTAANPAAELFFNRPARSLVGRPVFERIEAEAPLADAFARVRDNLAALFVNDVDLRAGGRGPQQVNLQIAPVGDLPDTIMLLIAPREIAERMGRALSVKASAKSAVGMAQMLAHEIKNPLAGITGAAQLLSMSLDEADREMTDLIVAETRRVLSLLEQVEQFGDQRPPDRRAVNLHDILERARKTAGVGVAAHMRIVEDYDPSLPLAWADGDQLLQVFLNLIKNAAEAAGSRGGTIGLRSFFDHGLRVRRNDGTRRALPLTVEIVDDGPGLPPSIAEQAFDPFVSGRENGTGLGLALVSKIVSEHEGWIAVESAPGRTVFRVSLPQVPDNTETD